jgi:hypothetical protein
MLKKNYPKTFAYFQKFREKMLKRPHYLQHFRAAQQPFWSMYNVGNYTFARHRVVWREQSSQFRCAVIEATTHSAPVADAKLIVVACNSADEAHYLAAALNSSPARFIVESYVVKVQISTHVLKHLAIPAYSSGDPVHKALAAQSKLCHKLAAKEDTANLANAEVELDHLAAQLWKLNNHELSRVRATVMAGSNSEGAEGEE